jgi:hypothetical protein
MGKVAQVGGGCVEAGIAVTVTVTWFRIYLNTPLRANKAHGVHCIGRVNNHHCIDCQGGSQSNYKGVLLKTAQHT